MNSMSRKMAVLGSGLLLGGGLLLAGVPSAAASDAAAAATTLAACENRASAPPGGGKWIVFKSGCSVAGHSGYKLGVSWQVQPGTNQKVCLQIKGGNGKWYGQGCGTRGKASVPWGNTLGQPSIRIKSAHMFHMANVNWRH